MPDDMEWSVPRTPVRDADRPTRSAGLVPPAPQRTERVAEVRRLVLDGHYASESMMDRVARRILLSGDL